MDFLIFMILAPNLNKYLSKKMDVNIMKISARNVLEGTVKKITEGVL